MDKAIITFTNIRCTEGSFPITKRYMNGILVGGHPGGDSIACHISQAKGSVSLRLVVAGHIDDPDGPVGWIHPNANHSMTREVWLAELRGRPALDWRRLLKGRLEAVPMVRLAIEDYSLDDLTILRDRGWYIGRSLHSVLWRVYALAPAAMWESDTEFPRFDGQIRSLDRFGAIYDPRRHVVSWR